MRTKLTALAASAIVMVCAALPVSAAPSNMGTSAAKCTTTGYSKNCNGCRKITSAGSFSIRVPQTKITVRGSGAKSKGTTICIVKVAAPRPSLGGVAIRVSATGKFAPLHIKKATMYLVNPASKAYKKVKAISAPGIYQVVIR